jgi:hypothetical protein
MTTLLTPHHPTRARNSGQLRVGICKDTLPADLRITLKVKHSSKNLHERQIKKISEVQLIKGPHLSHDPLLDMILAYGEAPGELVLEDSSHWKG